MPSDSWLPTPNPGLTAVRPRTRDILSADARSAYGMTHNAHTSRARTSA